MQKKGNGAKRREKDSHKPRRKLISESGMRLHREIQKELQKKDLQLLLKLGEVDVQAAVPNGIPLSVTSVDMKHSYPVSVRAANALVAELDHCWISSSEVNELVVDLVKWLHQQEAENDKEKDS